MKVVTSLVPSGYGAFTVWPCIFIRKEYDAPALLAHETVHLREQARWLVLPWLIAYGVSKKFRLGAEVRGHAAEIKAGGITLSGAAQSIARYNTGASLDDILALLRKELE